MDDVIKNILQKYTLDEFDVSDEKYESDIERIIAAFQTDSKDRKESLVEALRETSFVQSYDAESKEKFFSSPPELYIPSQRLK